MVDKFWDNVGLCDEPLGVIHMMTYQVHDLEIQITVRNPTFDVICYVCFLCEGNVRSAECPSSSKTNERSQGHNVSYSVNENAEVLMCTTTHPPINETGAYGAIPTKPYTGL